MSIIIIKLLVELVIISHMAKKKISIIIVLMKIKNIQDIEILLVHFKEIQMKFQ